MIVKDPLLPDDEIKFRFGLAGSEPGFVLDLFERKTPEDVMALVLGLNFYPNGGGSYLNPMLLGVLDQCLESMQLKLIDARDLDSLAINGPSSTIRQEHFQSIELDGEYIVVDLREQPVGNAMWAHSTQYLDEFYTEEPWCFIALPSVLLKKFSVILEGICQEKKLRLERYPDVLFDEHYYDAKTFGERIRRILKWLFVP